MSNTLLYSPCRTLIFSNKSYVTDSSYIDILIFNLFGLFVLLSSMFLNPYFCVIIISETFNDH